MRHHRLPLAIRQAAPFAGVVVAVVLIAAIVFEARPHHNGLPTLRAASLRLPPGKSPTARDASLVAQGGATPVAISAGDYSTCALVSGGVVECWGHNAHGQLGDGTRTNRLVATPVALDHGATQVSVGGSHACALLTSGRVECWGANEHGELGDGTTSDRTRPVAVASLSGVASVSAGVASTCAVLRSNAVDCWGANVDGQLGNGTHADSARPVRVSLQGNAFAVAVGLGHACALMQGGSVQCWGSNTNGQLGDGTTVDSAVPVRVAGLSGSATAIATGDAHTCALLHSGHIQCWGWNVEGQLGDGTGADSATPTSVIAIARARSLTAAGSDTCAVVGSGNAECWGSNIYGQLGDGSTLDQIGPVAVSGVGGATAVVTGLAHTCAVTKSGSATCWGQGVFGQLGNRAAVNSTTPVDVSGIGLAPDGSGQLVVSPTDVHVGALGTTLVFSYRAAAGGLRNGTLTLTPPIGWSVPSLKKTAQGYSTADQGVVDVAGGTINVRDLSLAGGSVVHVVYGSLEGHGIGAQTAGLGPQSWSAQEQSSVEGALTNLAPRLLQVLPADGAGTLTSSTQTIGHGGSETVTFVYTAGKGGLKDGAISVLVPAGWSPPSATASAGVVAISGRAIVVSGLRLKEGGKVTLTYRGTPPTTDVGSQSWNASERSGSSGALTALASSPTIGVLAPDGSGTLSTDTTTVASGSQGNALTFTFTPGGGGMREGTFTLVVPPGWSAPSTRSGDPGFVRVSTGSLSVSGQQIIVSLAKLPTSAASHLTVEYGVKAGGSSGARAPNAGADAEAWRALEQSSASGRARSLATPVLITVLAADGSGSLQRASSPTRSGAKDQTVVFMYVAAAGGVEDGELTLDVPSGWSAPSTDARAPGFVTSSAGTVTVHGAVITISGLSLNAGSALTIVYGNRARGGPGAVAPKVVGSKIGTPPSSRLRGETSVARALNRATG